MIVADSSPLIALSSIAQHELLPALFDRIVVPTAVWNELSARSDEPNRRELLSATWLSVAQPGNHDLVRVLEQTLGAGEAEAIALAIEHRASLLIMDERLGRSVASRFGLLQLGTVGLLVEAKRRGHIAAIKPLIQQLQRMIGFRLSTSLVERILADCDEG